MTQIIHAPHSGTQEKFLASSVEELFIGGEKGNGKSWLLLQEYLYDIDEQDANGILFRRTYPDLEDLWTKAHVHYAGFTPKFNDSSHLITFPSDARFKFSHLQHVKNVYNHTGQEYHFLGFDELPNFPQFVYLFMLSCLRSPNPKLRKRVRSTGNPVGEGVGWVKRRFIDSLDPFEIGFFKSINDRDVRASESVEKKLMELMEATEEEKYDYIKDKPELKDWMSRQWMPGVRSENITLMKNDPGYEAKLEALPEHLKRAFKHGIWDATDLPYQVVKSSHWKKAVEGVEVDPGRFGYIGADYAESKDKCSICSGRGNKVDRFYEFDGMKTYEFADKIEEEISRYGKHQCVVAVDANGPGAGVYHELQRRGHENITPCTFKDRSFEPKLNKPEVIKIKFDNFRSQAWWKLGEDMEAGEIDLSPLTSEDGYYDDIYKLEEEVLIHTYKLQNDRMIIIPKSELRKEQMGDGRPGLGRSPDRADALVYWNWVRGMKPDMPKPPMSKEGADYGVHDRKTKRKKRSGWT